MIIKIIVPVSVLFVLFVVLVFGVPVSAAENHFGNKPIRSAASDIRPALLAANTQEPTDEYLLSATPISQARMELIWLDPPKLENLAKKVKAAGGKLIVEYYETADNYRREYETTWADILWAKEVEKIIDIAWDAVQNNELRTAIQYYKKALVLAPGGDFFLMTIGVTYVELGEKQRGIRYLERAVQISPKIGRIRRNLENARNY